jgi:hypothetical protein
MLIGLVSFFVLPRIAAFHRHNAQATLAALRTFFAVLAFADVTHIAATLVDLGSTKFLEYNVLAHGSTTLVAGLFAWRTAWFLTADRTPTKVRKTR